MKLADLDTVVPPAASGGGASPGRDTSAYRVRGERVPSVTEVLDLGGLSDIEQLKADAGADVVERAARRGTVVHGFCDLVDMDDQFALDQVPDMVRGYVAAYVAWKRAEGFEPVEIERTVVSQRYGFAGTIDRLGIFPDGAIGLVDLKTPAAASPVWRVQTAGYELAVEDSGLSVVNRRGCLRLRPDGKFRWDEHQGRADTDLFLAALAVAHYRLAHGLAHLED